MDRRHLLKLAGVTVAGRLAGARAVAAQQSGSISAKPIAGSWLSILWDDRRHLHWNDTCAKFTAEQWEASVKEVAELGMEYMVLLAVAQGGKAFYKTDLLPKAAELACEDPIETLLAAADKYGVKFFVSCDWYGSWHGPATINKPEVVRPRLQMMAEVAAKYAHHQSFYGWYWPNEAYLNPYLTPEFVEYIDSCSRESRQLTPNAKTLTAPYFTHKAIVDDRFVRQLESLDVDIVAYQDEVGCMRATPDQTRKSFELLRRAHDRAPQRSLWADVETFAWEGEPNSLDSPLIPAPFARVKGQLEAVAPFVDKILIYQYQGIMSKPGSIAACGPPDAQKLYCDYRAWLEHTHPACVREIASAE